MKKFIFTKKAQFYKKVKKITFNSKQNNILQNRPILPSLVNVLQSSQILFQANKYAFSAYYKFLGRNKNHILQPNYDPYWYFKEKHAYVTLINNSNYKFYSYKTKKFLLFMHLLLNQISMALKNEKRLQIKNSHQKKFNLFRYNKYLKRVGDILDKMPKLLFGCRKTFKFYHSLLTYLQAKSKDSYIVRNTIFNLYKYFHLKYLKTYKFFFIKFYGKVGRATSIITHKKTKYAWEGFIKNKNRYFTKHIFDIMYIAAFYSRVPRNKLNENKVFKRFVPKLFIVKVPINRYIPLYKFFLLYLSRCNYLTLELLNKAFSQLINNNRYLINKDNLFLPKVINRLMASIYTIFLHYRRKFSGKDLILNNFINYFKEKNLFLVILKQPKLLSTGVRKYKLRYKKVIRHYRYFRGRIPFFKFKKIKVHKIFKTELYKRRQRIFQHRFFKKKRFKSKMLPSIFYHYRIIKKINPKRWIFTEAYHLLLLKSIIQVSYQIIQQSYLQHKNKRIYFFLRNIYKKNKHVQKLYVSKKKILYIIKQKYLKNFILQKYSKNFILQYCLYKKNDKH